MTSILSGLRVMDCGTFIAGPATATILSDFGAEVIKIERPPHGDPYRYLSATLPMMPASDLLYCAILTNRNKKSVALNLELQAARDALLKLIATADVFITNYQPQLLRKFCLTYEDLQPASPRLIYASVTGYGELGDDSEKPGFDANAYWARSGLMDYVRDGDSDPTITPGGAGDHPTASALFGGIMLALYQRDRTGQGAKVTTSLMAAGAWANACFLQGALLGATPKPRLSRKNSFMPTANHYVSKDGHRFLLALIDPVRDWLRLCNAVDQPALAVDPRFDSLKNRAVNGAALVSILDGAFAQKTMDEWAAIFRRLDVPWASVPHFTEIPDDPQFSANGVWTEIDHPVHGSIRTIDSPIRIQGVPKVKPRLVPEVGAQTVEVLASLGYTETEVDALLASGAAAKA